MRSVRMLLILTLAGAPAALAQNATPTAAAAGITPEDVKKHLAIIASDSLRGRDTPSPGLEMAAKYVADQFKADGIAPAGDSGSYIQRWPYHASKLAAPGVTATVKGVSGAHKLSYGKDFFVVASPAADSLAGTITFAGASTPATAPNPALAGKIAAYTVAGTEMNADWVANVRPAIMAAIGSGAKGVVLILDPGLNAETVAEIASNVEDTNVPLPVLGLRNDVARDWLKGTSLDIATPPASATLQNVDNASVQVHTAMSGVNGNPPNTVGILEGSDPVLKNTYVVFSAHMDHLGVGRPNAKGDSIYNGADDDGSGTTAIIEVAKAFSSLAERPKRSLIFLGVSGEEKGLFGSKFFTEHPPVPIDKIVADINIDMIGRNNPDTTVAIGQEYSSLGSTTQAVVKAHPELHLVVAPDLWPQEGLFFRSDHFNFAVKKIPAIFFTSGLHKDYHQPSDEVQLIDNDKLARTARLVFWLGSTVANSEEAPTWTKAGLSAISQAGGQ